MVFALHNKFKFNNKKTIKLLLLCLLLLPSLSFAQNNCNYTLSGNISSDAEGTLPYVNVYVHETESGTNTDENGKYQLTNLCKQFYRIIISHLNHQKIDTTIEVSNNTTLNLTLKQTSTGLDEVIVEAEKSKENAAQTIQQLEEKELESTRGKSLGDAVKEIAGVQTFRTGAGFSKPVIQGLYGSRVLILVNGVRLSGQQWSQDVSPEIDPFIAQKISVIKGAGTVRYGTDAMGGIILLSPPVLKYEPGFEGEMSLIGFSANKQSVVSGQFGGNHHKLPNFSWRVQGTFNMAGNARTPNYYQQNTGFEEKSFTTQLGYQKENYGVEFFYNLYNSEKGIYRGAHIHTLLDLQNRVTNEIPDTIPFTYDIIRPRQDVEHELYKLSGFYRFKNLSKLKLDYSRQFNNRQEFDVFHAYNILPENDIPQMRFSITTHDLNAEWEYFTKVGLKGNVGVNGNLKRNTINNIGFLPEYDNYTFGLYVIEQYSTNDNRLSLEAGARLNLQHYSIERRDSNDFVPEKLNFQNVGLNMGANYRIMKHLSANLTLGTAWRAPDAIEMFVDGLQFNSVSFTQGIYAHANSNGDTIIKAPTEKMFSSVFSVSYNDNKYFKANIGVFANVFTDYIFITPNSDKSFEVTIRGIFPAYHYKQTDALFKGGNYLFEMSPVRGFSIGTKGAMVRGTDKADTSHLPLIVPDNFEYYLKFKTDKKLWVFKDLNLKIAMQQFNKQFRYNEEIIINEVLPPPSGYYLFNAAAGMVVEIGKQDIVFGFSVENIANEVYRSYLNRMRFYIDEVGRNYSLRMQIPFRFKSEKK